MLALRQLVPACTTYQSALLQATTALGDGDAARTACQAAAHEGPLSMSTLWLGSQVCSNMPNLAACSAADTPQPSLASSGSSSTTAGSSGTASSAHHDAPGSILHSCNLQGCFAFTGCAPKDFGAGGRQALLAFLQQAGRAVVPEESSGSGSIAAHIDSIKTVRDQAGNVTMLVQFQVSRHAVLRDSQRRSKCPECLVIVRAAQGKWQVGILCLKRQLAD